jgi:hypothetical protein
MNALRMMVPSDVLLPQLLAYHAIAGRGNEENVPVAAWLANKEEIEHAIHENEARPDGFVDAGGLLC